VVVQYSGPFYAGENPLNKLGDLAYNRLYELLCKGNHILLLLLQVMVHVLLHLQFHVLLLLFHHFGIHLILV
jgi:hypothetical protein